MCLSHVPLTFELTLAGKQAGRQAGRLAGWQASMQAGRQANRQVDRQAIRRACMQTGKQASMQAGRQAGMQAGRQEARQAGRQAGRLARPVLKMWWRERLPRLQPELAPIPEDQVVDLRWRDLVNNLIFWINVGQWDGMSLKDKIDMLELFEDS